MIVKIRATADGKAGNTDPLKDFVASVFPGAVIREEFVGKKEKNMWGKGAKYRRKVTECERVCSARSCVAFSFLFVLLVLFHSLTFKDWN